MLALMDEPRRLGIVRDYDELHALLRQRADELAVSRSELDDATKLADGYCGKLLGAGQVKGIGKVSLGPILDVLGLALIVVEDPAAMARHQQLPKRDNRWVRWRRPTEAADEAAAETLQSA